ncbi:PqqD family protein [Lysinibacillus fusiformis]|uniref:PqqD family protein n=1 Tax=Lysinibacillus fusiformis TaxID=28031 RepID=UPI0011A98091|nr:PqqD family protein [Lysinibacillus fusiformis]
MVKEMRVKKSKYLLSYKEEDEYLIINIYTNQIYALDKFSSFIWEELDRTPIISDISRLIAKRTNEDILIIQKDLDGFFNSLSKGGLIKFV